jgi:hypothetical protein
MKALSSVGGAAGAAGREAYPTEAANASAVLENRGLSQFIYVMKSEMIDPVAN